MQISVKCEDKFRNCFDGDEYIINFSRNFEGYKEGDIICYVAPWSSSGCPIGLEFAIRDDGSIAFRKWEWKSNYNPFVHIGNCPINETPTQAQIDTVNGMFSGRIKVFGLHLCPGRTLQNICPIDVDAEEKRIGKRIYLA